MVRFCISVNYILTIDDLKRVISVMSLEYAEAFYEDELVLNLYRAKRKPLSEILIYTSLVLLTVAPFFYLVFDANFTGYVLWYYSSILLIIAMITLSIVTSIALFYIKKLAAKEGNGLTDVYCTETLNLLLPLILFIFSDGSFIGTGNFLLTNHYGITKASIAFLPLSILDSLPIIYLMSMH